jgi:UDP-N-acetylmuramate: L-alanyl-gamma-D-glutamyl-meso-diaminopimelate ligase
MEKPKQIHLTAIAGVGMAALAGLLKEAGHHVSGSDTAIFPPMSTLLERVGIVCKNGFRPEHIGPLIDCVIIGNAVSRDNPEVLETIARGIPYYSLPQALSHFFLDGRRPLVVTGTHGKTTTTSLLSFFLFAAQADPSVMVGGIMKNWGTNYRLGKGDCFVIEGDEYNSAFFDKEAKFLHYRPYGAILTSIEKDHVDMYPDLESIQSAFRKFVRLIPKEGVLVASYEPAVMEVVKEASCKIITYGLDPMADWHATNIQFGERITRFDLMQLGEKIASVDSPLMGRHNIKNLLGVIALAESLGFTPNEALLSRIQEFEGVARRQEVVGVVRDIMIIDDFAHHPTAIGETLFALRARYPKRRLWAVFEPTSASSRRNVFQQEFVTAFEQADATVLAGLFSPDKVPVDQRLDPEQVISDLKGRGKAGFFIPTVDEIVAFLSEQLVPGDMVCIMSSRGFGGIHAKLIAAQQARKPLN